MADEMRQELNGVTTAVGALGVQVNAIKTGIDTLAAQMNALASETRSNAAQMNALASESRSNAAQMNDFASESRSNAAQMNDFALETRSRLGRLEAITRSTAIVAAGHTEEFSRIKQRLTKLDELDGIKKCLEVFTAEIIASRHERALTGKSFSDQQSMLTDHELRLTRIELRGKQS